MKRSFLVGYLYCLMSFSGFVIVNLVNLTPSTAQTNYIYQLLQLTNAQRQAAGLPPLQLSSTLTQAAQRHADDMAKNGLIEHQGSDGSNPIDRANEAGYLSSYIGENISAGRATPEAVIEAWLNNPQHQRNLLDPNYTEVGFGYIQDENSPYQYYWVQLLGSSTENPQAFSDSPLFSSPSSTDCQGEQLLSALNCTDDGLNREERNLVAQINQYRRENQLSSLAVSPALTRLANRHVRDLIENEQRYDRRGQNWRFGWSNCPFDENQPITYDCMWKAPQRLNTGYLGNGYEIICGGNSPITAEIALSCWQNSVDNREFLLNQGQWQNYRWNAMGVAIYRNYAVLWFGESLDEGSPTFPPSDPQKPNNSDRIW